MSNVPITNIRVIKNRPLDSKWRDPDYPRDSTPFYMYGTTAQKHADHLLLKAPNAQITSDLVDFTFDDGRKLTRDELARGVIIRALIPERAIQPLDDTNSGVLFCPGATYRATAGYDPRHARAHGPGLASVGGEAHLGEGMFTLGKSVFIDTKQLNTQDFAPEARVADYTVSGASARTKAEWKDVVRSSLPGLSGGVAASLPGVSAGIGGGLSLSKGISLGAKGSLAGVQLGGGFSLGGQKA